MISTAPYSRALKVLSAPSSARLEQITTGIGCWLMIFLRKVSPSMRGISMSSVITSGHLLGDAVRSDKGIAGRGDHFDLGVGGENLLQRLAHHGRVVHDQHANFGCIHDRLTAFIGDVRHGELLRDDCRFSASRVGIEPPQQHFACCCLELNVHARGAAQAGTLTL